MPTAPRAIGTAVAAAIAEEELLPEAPVADPDVEPDAEVAAEEAPEVAEANAELIDCSALDCAAAREVASLLNEAFALPVAVAASEDSDAMAELAAPSALERRELRAEVWEAIAEAPEPVKVVSPAAAEEMPELPAERAEDTSD